MTDLLHQLIETRATITPDAEALLYREDTLSYSCLSDRIGETCHGLAKLGLEKQERVGIYLEKRLETVFAIFGATQAGGVFVPLNPLLKGEQVQHILCDCNVRILVTSRNRLEMVAPQLRHCPNLHTVVIVDDKEDHPLAIGHLNVISWSELTNNSQGSLVGHRVIDTDMASIIYTSGSTGKPKGVVLSHRNMVAGAKSVATYLQNTPKDRLLAALPLSFDAGFSQLSTAFYAGASVVLMNYLLARDVVNAASRYKITGLGAVPPMWIPLSRLSWPEDVVENLRYITNTGGAMPRTIVNALRQSLPKTQVFLMYGLTEAFRSTYLPPEEIDKRPDSIGKAIPNAEILVVRKDGSPCSPNEPGELIHRGALVAQGYWNDSERTAQRFRPTPGKEDRFPGNELSVWSGDTVRMDEEGYLYFIGRRDEMIKTSGYRVSPTEVEEALYRTGFVREAIVYGSPHSELGQAIVAIVVLAEDKESSSQLLLSKLRPLLPNFMLPAHVEFRESFPRNPNGKLDRSTVISSVDNPFTVAGVNNKR